jgi:DNA topoisomerase-2
MFNKDGVITKYSSVEDILKEFYLIRLDYYAKRKEYKLKIVKRELDIISMKIKFINDFINNEIQIIDMDDDDIYEQLEEREYIKFPKNPNEIDNVDDELTYDYLLNMMIRTLTKKKMNELKNKHELKKTEYNELLEKNIIDIWKYDLNNFKEMYIKYLNIHTEKMNMIEKPAPSLAKKKK